MSGGAKNTSGDQTLQSKSGSSSPQVDQRRVTRRAKAEKVDKSKRAMDSDSESCSKEDAWSGDNDSVNRSESEKKNVNVRSQRKRSPAKQTTAIRETKKVVVPSSRDSRVQRSCRSRTFERPTSVQVKMTKNSLKPPPEPKKNADIKAHLREVLKDKPFRQGRRSSV